MYYAALAKVHSIAHDATAGGPIVDVEANIVSDSGDTDLLIHGSAPLGTVGDDSALESAVVAAAHNAVGNAGLDPANLDIVCQAVRHV